MAPILRTSLAAQIRRPGTACWSGGQERPAGQARVLTIPAGAPPGGSGVGELGSSVSVPPCTAKTDRMWLALPSTDSVLPPGDRRGALAPPPPRVGGLPGR